jgi:hypothetical protein
MIGNTLSGHSSAAPALSSVSSFTAAAEDAHRLPAFPPDSAERIGRVPAVVADRRSRIGVETITEEDGRMGCLLKIEVRVREEEVGGQRSRTRRGSVDMVSSRSPSPRFMKRCKEE